MSLRIDDSDGDTSDIVTLLAPSNTVTNRYGQRWDAPHETAYPSTFILDQQGTVVFEKLSKGHAKPALVSQETSTALRFRADGFTTLRKKFAMSAEQMGKLIGVSAQSVYHWEAGKSRPRASQLPAISAARQLTKKQAWEKIS